MTRSALALALLALAASPAAAQQNECRRAPALAEGADPMLGHVVSAGRVRFVKDGLAQAGCPDASPSCAARGYLVPGDRVILAQRAGGYVCAAYPHAKTDDDTIGWLPEAAVTAEPATSVATGDWLGTWTQIEAEVAIKPGKAPGALAMRGDATWGGGDPDRVRRGGVHTGEFEGEVKPTGATASFAIGTMGAVPVEKGESTDCKVWMRRVGPWLVVDDNLACGGMNVTFKGIYRRTAS
jgi:hypothetical protein